MNNFFDSRENCGFGFLNVRLPHSDNGVSSLLEISVLPFINPHAPDLASIRGRELYGMSMPVVAIELHNQPTVVEVGVNAELAKQKLLLLIRHADRVQNLVAGRLQFVDLFCRLLNVHLNQLDTASRIGISTRRSAVRRSGLRLPRWRPREADPANFTRVVVSIPTLPFDLVRGRAEEIFCSIDPKIMDVNGLATKGAGYICASLSLRPRIVSIAFQRAVFLPFPHVVSHNPAAAYALNCANFIPKLSFGQLKPPDESFPIYRDQKANYQANRFYEVAICATAGIMAGKGGFGFRIREQREKDRKAGDA